MLDAIGCALAARREDFAERFANAIAGARRRWRRRPQRRDRPRDAAAVARRRAAERRADPRPRLRRHAHGRRHPPERRACCRRCSRVAGAARAPAAPRCWPPTSPRSRPARASRASTRSGLHAHGFHPTGVVGAFAAQPGGRPTDRACRRSSWSTRRAPRCRWPAAACSSSRTAPGPSASIRAGRRRPAITAATFAAHGIAAPQSPYEGRYGFYRLLSRRGRARRHRPGAGHRGPRGRRQRERVGDRQRRDQAVPDVPLRPCQRRRGDRAAPRGLDAARIRAVEVRVPAGVVPVGLRADRQQAPADERLRRQVQPAVRGRQRPAARPPRPEGARAGRLPRPGGAGADGHASTTRSIPIRPSRATTPARCASRSTTARALVHRESVNRGHAERPLSNDEVREKFFDNAGLHFLARARRSAICDAGARARPHRSACRALERPARDATPRSADESPEP